MLVLVSTTSVRRGRYTSTKLTGRVVGVSGTVGEWDARRTVPDRTGRKESLTTTHLNGSLTVRGESVEQIKTLLTVNPLRKTRSQL